MKMFPGSIISQLKKILTGSGSGPTADGNDRKRKSVVPLDIESKKPRLTTLSSIPVPPPVEEPFHSKPLFATAASAVNPATTAAGIKQNGGTCGTGFASSMANIRRLSGISDVPRANQSERGSLQYPPLHGSSTVNRATLGGVTASRPLASRRTNNGPPNLIPIQYTTLRSSYGGQQRGSSINRSIPFAAGKGSGREQRFDETGAVPELTSDFHNLLRPNYSTSPSASYSSSAAYMTALDRDLQMQREANRKYEALKKKFIPIVIDPQPRGAYDRFKRTIGNGNVQRTSAAGAKGPAEPSSVLTDDETNDDREESDDDCVEIVSSDAFGNSGRLFTTIGPAELSLLEEQPAEQQQQTKLEPVNTVRERFQTKQVYRDNIIQDVQQRYGILFNERKTLISQEQERLSSIKSSTKSQESEMRNKMHQYVSSFYAFDSVLDETKIKDVTPEPEEVPLPVLTKEQVEQMHRKLRTGNQLVIEKFNLPITGNDLVTLQGMNWLNDAVINFYMELLRERSEQKRDQGLPKLYTMNTFFLQRLLQSGYAAVRRWTRKVDLLAHDMIVVPVHVGGIHWCMATIDLRRKTIQYFDSMGAPNDGVLNALESYLCQESLDKRKQPFDTTGLVKQNMRDCPRQKNGSDCGVFSCMFAEFLARDHAITFDQSNMPYFRQKMTVEIMLGKLLT